jgi:hypothetical protein
VPSVIMVGHRIFMLTTLHVTIKSILSFLSLRSYVEYRWKYVEIKCQLVGTDGFFADFISFPSNFIIPSSS